MQAVYPGVSKIVLDHGPVRRTRTYYLSRHFGTEKVVKSMLLRLHALAGHADPPTLQSKLLSGRACVGLTARGYCFYGGISQARRGLANLNPSRWGAMWEDMVLSNCVEVVRSQAETSLGMRSFRSLKLVEMAACYGFDGDFSDYFSFVSESVARDQITQAFSVFHIAAILATHSPLKHPLK